MNNLYEILVPTCRPDKKDKFFTTRYHKVWDSKVRDIAGGLTILTPSKGQWISKDGELYSERVIPVRIACNESQINLITDMTAKHYMQKAIMFYQISNNVIIKHY